MYSVNYKYLFIWKYIYICSWKYIFSGGNFLLFSGVIIFIKFTVQKILKFQFQLDFCILCTNHFWMFSIVHIVGVSYPLIAPPLYWLYSYSRYIYYIFWVQQCDAKNESINNRDSSSYNFPDMQTIKKIRSTCSRRSKLNVIINIVCKNDWLDILEYLYCLCSPLLLFFIHKLLTLMTLMFEHLPIIIGHIYAFKYV